MVVSMNTSSSIEMERFISSGMRPNTDFAVVEREVRLIAGPESMQGGKNL